MEFVLIVVGFVLLIKFADFFIDASVSIAKYYNISEIIIGATIVAIGTTLPETLVSAVSAIKGHGDISYGNAIGSIICNTALISAISLLFKPSDIDKSDITIPIRFFFASFIFYVINAYIFKRFNRFAGVILVLIFVAYVYCILRTNKNTINNNGITNNSTVNIPHKNTEIIKSFLLLIVSAIVIAFASNLLVDNGIIIARRFGVPESVIGITLIALGTSLPELTTAITSLVKGHSNLSIGNIIGANFFNIVNVTGIAAILNPFDIPSDKEIFGIHSSLIVDIPVTLVVMLILCIPTLINAQTKRWQGALLLIIYISFIIYQITVI